LQKSFGTVLDDDMNYELLTDVAKVIMGQSPPSSTYNAVGEGLPFYQGKTDFGDMYPTPRVYCTEPSRIAEAGDILISVRAPVGPTNVSQERSCIGRGISAIRVGKNLDRDFLLYFLRFYEPELAKAGTGSTFTAISREDLETIKIPLPPLTEQKRIASLLARADRLRQLRRTAHDLSGSVLQSVFLEMFGDAEKNEKQWELSSLVDLCIAPFTNGVTLTQDAIGKGTKLVNIVDLYESHTINTSNLGRVEVSDKQIKTSKLQEGDIIFVRSSVKREGAAMCAYFPGDVEPVVFGCFNIRFRPDLSRVNSIFLTSFLRTQEGRKRLLERCQTATITNINQEGLGSIVVPVPPLSLQEEFAGVVARVESLPLAPLGDFVRGRMGESERQALW
jgi:type I restriction enzyme S subunit